MKNTLHKSNRVLLDLLDFARSIPGPPSSCDIAESYRIKLGLQPWDERGGHRSGKTTRLILRALAECVVDSEATVIIVVQDPIVNWTDRYVNKLAHQLGVDRSRVAVMAQARATRKKSDRQWEPFPKRMIELHDFD